MAEFVIVGGPCEHMDATHRARDVRMRIKIRGTGRG
jgi:hypothetical protein